MSLRLDPADGSWTRYKIDKPSFLKRYETFFDSIGRNPTNPKIDGDSLRWLPLMFIVVSGIIKSQLTIARHSRTFRSARTHPECGSSGMVTAILRLGQIITRIRQSAPAG